MESPQKSQSKIKGVVLAGGLGTRLRPLTSITNKHLLPVYDKPMILYPVETLRRSGITDILVVCGREHAGDFINFLGSGKEYGIKISYAVQDRNNAGIADALSYAKDFSDGRGLAVILGDNIFEDKFSSEVRHFKKGARIFLKKVSDPHRYGVAVFDKSNKKVIRVEEKPLVPKSDYAQTGFYLFDKRIFSFMEKIKPSARGEFEITDAINRYIRDNSLKFSIVEGGWYDAGTVDSLLEAAQNIKIRKDNDL